MYKRQPLLLYGYGSYGSTINPRFSSVRLSLLDRGFVYAIAHNRRSQNLVRKRYEAEKIINTNKSKHKYRKTYKHIKTTKQIKIQP